MTDLIIIQNRSRATLIGASAVLMWSTLALFTTLTGKVPPFQLVAMAFSVAFILSLIKWQFTQEGIVRHLRLPLPVWALGVGGGRPDGGKPRVTKPTSND